MRPAVIEPVIPQPNRRRVEYACVVLASFALGGRGAIRGIGLRAGVDHAREQDRAPVWTPQWTRGPGGNVRHPLRLTTSAQVEHVDLRDVVAFASRAERDAATVGTPLHAALAGFGVGQPAWLGAPVRRHEPQIADLLAFGIGGLGHREDDPAPIG